MDEIKKIIDNIEKVIIGKRRVIERLIIALLCGGHVIIEDVPGVGKTTLVKALARSIDCTFKRIQFTPDLLPSDIVGITMFNQRSGTFEFKEGPIMSNLVLADEINRSSPRTQSALLEAMAERCITVDGYTRELPEPFMVIATQNPVEFEGTFPLPEAQLDRFMIKLSLGYPDRMDEEKILRHFDRNDPLENLSPVASAQDIIKMRENVKRVYADETIDRYIVSLAERTRSHRSIYLGISPRGSRDLFLSARTHAFLKGRDYVLPDDVKQMIPFVFSHRIKLNPEARLKGVKIDDVLKDIQNQTPVPVVKHHEAG